MDKLQAIFGKTKIVLAEPGVINVLTERVPHPLFAGSDEMVIDLFDDNNFCLVFDNEDEAKRAFYKIIQAKNPMAYAKAVFNGGQK